MFEAFEFCLPTNATKVPAGPEWLHEIKHDGLRIRVEHDGDRVRLITRGGYNWTKRYPQIGCRSLCAQVSGANRRHLVPRRLELEHFGRARNVLAGRVVSPRHKRPMSDRRPMPRAVGDEGGFCHCSGLLQEAPWSRA